MIIHNPSDYILESVKKYLQPPLDESDVVVRKLPINHYSIALDNNIEMLWNERDFKLAEKYKLRILNGEQAPAILIRPGGEVVDGFHRLYAAFSLGLKDILAIDLHELGNQILKWYPEDI